MLVQVIPYHLGLAEEPSVVIVAVLVGPPRRGLQHITHGIINTLSTGGAFVVVAAAAAAAVVVVKKLFMVMIGNMSRWVHVL